MVLRYRKYIRRTSSYKRRGSYRKKFSWKRKMFRKTKKIELKWVNTASTHIVNAAAFNSYDISALNIAQGVGLNQRVGNKVKFLRVKYHFEFRADNLGTYTLPYQRVRVILWCARIASATATSYMNGLNETDFPDPNVCTLYKDVTFNLYQIGFAGVNTEPTQSDYQLKQYHGSVSFPRVVTFPSNTSTSTDLDFKDRLSITIITMNTGGPQVQFMYRCRTTYVDI